MNSRRDRLKRAIALGVPIAFGSDAYASAPGETRAMSSLGVLRSYLDAGMSPMAVIQAATINAARLLQRDGELGFVGPQALADIIAVDGDPIADPPSLAKIRFVMMDGTVVRGPTP